MSKKSANSYGVAIAAVTVAVLVRWLLDPWLGDDQPLVTLFGAVAVAEWFSGPYPTVVGAILGYLVCDWLFQAPRGAIGVENLQTVIGFIAYLISCAVIVGFGEVMRRARVRAEQLGEVLREEVTRRRRSEDVLRDYAEQLKQADRHKDEFLAILSHELRNPLGPISNAVELLKGIGPSDSEFVWNREVIERQVEYIVRLLDDLLDVNRVTRNKLELRKTRVTSAQVLQGAIETSQPGINNAGHELTVSLPTEPVYIEADAIRLAQVFSNLLNNATKFTPEGGHIRLSAEREGDEITVSVKDNGIGIQPEMLPRVFEMFAQAEPLYERSREGLGIGLWLVKSLVEMHGGTITARSDGVGKGSEFTVRLPVITSKVTADSGRKREDDESQRGKIYRILVVDDRKNSADILTKLLKKNRHDVQTAYGGQEALLAAEKFKPEVVLLDIGMPNMNGFEVCRQIRKQPWGEAMYLIAVSGWGQEQDRHRSAEAGFDHHLVKPVHSEILMKVLDSIRTSRLINTESCPTLPPL